MRHVQSACRALVNSIDPDTKYQTFDPTFGFDGSYVCSAVPRANRESWKGRPAGSPRCRIASAHASVGDGCAVFRRCWTCRAHDLCHSACHGYGIHCRLWNVAMAKRKDWHFQEAEIRSARHQNIDDKVKSMIEIGDIPAPGRSQGRVRICKVCGKEGVTIAILGHVKAKHLKHLTTPSLPCEECGKQFISNREFAKHMQQCAPRQMLSNVFHRAVGEPI